MRGTMKENPVITVIIPVYNILDCLERCVRSVTAQTYKNLEILLIDDGSTDGTGELCDRLAREDDRIRVFHKGNGGSSSARNLGLRQATGEYVGFVDSDDYIDPDMYERLLRAVADYDVTAAQAARDEIDADGRRLPDICVPPSEPEVWESRDFFRELLLHRGDCSFCTKLLKRELFQDRFFPEGKLNEDFRLLIQMLPQIGRIVSLPQQCYHVFYRIGSNSRKADPNCFSRVYADCVENADLAQDLARGDAELATVALRFAVFQRLEYLLHIPIPQMRKDNQTYREIVSYLRKNWLRAMKNPVLTKKNKLYHTLFALSPAGVRRVHRRLRSCNFTDESV